MLYLYYYVHLALNSKYKVLLQITILGFIYFIIFNTLYNDSSLIECMKRSNPLPSTLPDQTDTNYMHYLEAENTRLRQRIFDLETQINVTSGENYANDIKNQMLINSLEDDQKYFADENTSLREQVTEANDTIREVAGNNLDLRSNAQEMQESYNTTKQDFETAKKQYEDATEQIKKN